VTDPAALAGVLGAVHEAADAVARMARADLTGITAAAAAGRLYIDSRVIGDERVQIRYTQAPGDRVHLLRNAYHLCAGASLRAATALDRLAASLGTSSRSLAIRRAASIDRDIAAPETGYELDPGAFAERMTFFERPYYGRMRQRGELDASAVVRAREVDGLTLQQIADRFTVTVDSVKNLLDEHGKNGPKRKRRAAAQLAALDGTPKPDLSRPPDTPSEVFNPATRSGAGRGRGRLNLGQGCRAVPGSSCPHCAHHWILESKKGRSKTALHLLSRWWS
jgi:hypothetical protein